MFHYLFTNDLRIRNLDEALHDAGKCFAQGRVPSADTDKNANNNMNTLGFYFNLTKDSQCALDCADGNIRRVVLNFIKKFQFPNPRTKDSFQLAVEDGITIAPMRVILQVLYLLHMTGLSQEAYLTVDEIAQFIFFNPDAAKKRQPDLAGIVRKIKEFRRSGMRTGFLSDDDREMEQKGCYWKQCKRQLREMVKVLCWSGCVQETRKGVIEIYHEGLTQENKADLFDILTFTGMWTPKEYFSRREQETRSVEFEEWERLFGIQHAGAGKSTDSQESPEAKESRRHRENLEAIEHMNFQENKRAYQRYMDIEPENPPGAVFREGGMQPDMAFTGEAGGQLSLHMDRNNTDKNNTDKNINKSPLQEPVYRTGLLAEFDRNRIVFGAPGTGKSYRLNQDAQALLKNTSGTMERVTFHPDYSYAQFAGTYKPVSDGGAIEYRFVPGPFMRVYADALKSGRTDSPQPHILLVEEINRARVAAVFGDIFQLLDRDAGHVSEYRIQASEDIRRFLAAELGGQPQDYPWLCLPDNLFIWATMNSADQGVFPMDTAFKRRWNFEYLGIDESQELAQGYRIPAGMGPDRRYVNWNRLRRGINQILAQECRVNEDKLLGPFFLSKNMLEGALANEDAFVRAFESKVLMYLFEDVMKMRPGNIFKGHKGLMIFSEICRAYEDQGEGIFGLDFSQEEQMPYKEGI